MTYYKYQRTSHFPWSQGATNDDKIIPTLNQFENRRVIVTRKMDGENTSIYRNHTHARSTDSQHHVSRDWLKQYASTFQSDIPDGWRICGENLYATHSIHYTNLESYFYGFSIWNSDNVRLCWDETLEWFDLLNIVPVETLYDDVYNPSAVFDIQYALDFDEEDEGFVMTVADEIAYEDFTNFTVKYVRPNHVRTGSHWKNQAVIPNELIKKD